jgi:hypothetical protein
MLVTLINDLNKQLTDAVAPGAPRASSSAV